MFVGDVTPVGKGSPYTNDEGVHSDGKLIMNPNVAIELGYALKTRTTDNVLMVMNSHYGKRSDLPFDLGHKGGPIMYKLGPGATNDEIEREKKSLAAKLRDALSEYIQKPVTEPFAEMKPKIGQGIYFDNGEILGEDKNSLNKTKYTMPFRQIMWLRLIPTKSLEIPLSIQRLEQSVASFGTFGISDAPLLRRQNAYGVAFFIPADDKGNIDAISQYSRDGEIWGMNAKILREGRIEESWIVSSLLMENLFITNLELYVNFMRMVSGVSLPIQVEAGIEGIKGRVIVHNGHVFNGAGVMHKDNITHRAYLKSFETVDQREFLLELFTKVNNNTGVPRPAGLYGRG